MSTKLNEKEVRYLIACVEYMRSQVGERYTWPGDPNVRYEKAALTRLLKKLKLQL